MASGPPSHSAYKEEVGQTVHVTRFAATTAHCPNPNPIQRVALPAAGSTTASTTTAGLHTYTKRRCLAQIFIDEPVKAGSSSDGQMLLHLSLSLSPTPKQTHDSTGKN